MRINLTKIFELNSLPEKIRPDVQGLVAFLNTGFDQLVRVLSNGITIRDNLNAEVKVLTFRTNIANVYQESFTPTKSAIEGIQILQTVASDGSNSVGSFTWTRANDGGVTVTIYPRVTMTAGQKIDVKLMVLFS